METRKNESQLEREMQEVIPVSENVGHAREKKVNSRMYLIPVIVGSVLAAGALAYYTLELISCLGYRELNLSF